VPLVAIPKTMDNDVPGTDYCIGFSTAITRAKELIDRQRTTLGSHERIGVFRIFGRDAGFSALFAAYVTSARCVIPEAPYDLDALCELLAADHAANPSHYAFVITAEGAIWQGAARIVGIERGIKRANGHCLRSRKASLSVAGPSSKRSWP
jgi:6-phosphofructokinase 1